MRDPLQSTAPRIVAVDMGYGHLRAAKALADAAGVPMIEADRAPAAGPLERAVWSAARRGYGLLSRAAGSPRGRTTARPLLDALTGIPRRGEAPPAGGVRLLGLLRRLGLGRRLLRDRSPLVATFYAQAILADAAGLEEVWLVVTDADVNRVWVPADPARTRIGFLAPCARTARRLRDYGVPLSRIRVTGFPLPPSLLGGPGLGALDRNLAARLARLDPAGGAGPPTVTFCVGGSGAQANLGVRAIPAFRPFIERGELRLALVAGVHGEAAAAFRRAGAALAGGRGLEILEARDFADYEPRFNELLSRTDVLWTKPGELVFFAALGLPLLLAPPLGVHERRNRRMAIHGGFALDGRDPAAAPAVVMEALRSGRLTEAALRGRARLPARGSYRILDVVAGRA